jgi:imidazolonepropionase-like amidohydrolase
MGYRAIRAAVDARRVLLAGVTTSCDPGGPRGIATAVRDAIDIGLIEGPRMAAAGRQMTTQQGIGDSLPAPLGDAPTSYGAIVRSWHDIVQVIRDEVKEGVDMVKVAGSGPGTIEYGAFSLDELRLITSEVHRLDRPTAIHARSRQSIADAVEAGFDWLMHASYMDAATAEKVAERRIPIVPAMTLLVNFLEAGPGWMPQEALDGIKRELESAVDVLGRAWRNGVTLVAGSESGFAMTPYGEWHTREMELFVDLLGMSDFDALLCMTKYAGSAIPRFGHEVGTLAPGKFADLLVVDGRPDKDVKILGQRNRLLKVMKGGQFVDLSVPVPERIMQSFERTRIYTRGLHRRRGS